MTAHHRRATKCGQDLATKRFADARVDLSGCSRVESGWLEKKSFMPKRIGKLTRGLGAIVWLYVAVLAVVWLLLRFGGDRWWFATLILFGPRWLCAVPLAALVPAAALVRRRLLWPLTAAAVVAIGPIMGFCLPWARLAPRAAPRSAS